MGEDDVGSELRPRQVLDGEWEFLTDPCNQGESGNWHTLETKYPNVISVPGNWQAQGYGEENRHLRHDYQGKAWYRVTAKVPDCWLGKRVWLHFGGVASSGEAYVNGCRAGLVETFITPYEFDVTDLIRTGAENSIACCVDSTGIAPVGMFNFIGRWGGLYRGVYLEARPDPAIDDVFVVPDVKNATARTRVVLRRSASGSQWEGRLSVRVVPVTGGQSHVASVGAHISSEETESEPTFVDVAIDDVRTWTPEDPFLYDVIVSLSANGERVDEIRDRFGMRQFETTEDGVLLLNGRPYFIRGVGDDTVEVLTGTSSTDKRVHAERIAQAKRFGFNGCRFLSHTPGKEFFEAADEAGFLVMASNEIYRRIKEVIPLLKRQVTRIAKCYRNHPSWYAWSAGNEIFECQGSDPDPDWMDYVRYAHDTFKSLDSTRFFVASDGVDLFPTDIITLHARFGQPSKYSQPYDGRIGEVSYFGRALSDTEMAGLAQIDPGYERRVRSLEPSAYWRLDDPTADRAADSSGNGNDGVYDPSMMPENLCPTGVGSLSGIRAGIRVDARHTGVNLQGIARSVFAWGDEPFSVSMWVWPSGLGTSDDRTMFSCGTPSAHKAFLIGEHGHLSSVTVTVGRYQDSFITSTGRLMVGEWNHVGVTYDGAVCKLFLNGAPDASHRVSLDVVQEDARIGRLITNDVGQSDVYQSRPHIWHEFNNQYVGPFPDISLKDRYTGVFKDHNCLSFHEDQFAALGLLERYTEVRKRSVNRFQLHLKSIFEQARRSRTLDGFGYWCLTDYPGDVEGDHAAFGVCNPLYEPDKFPTPEPMLPFNSATVILSDIGEYSAVVPPDRPRRIVLGISHYGESTIDDGRLFWQVASDGAVLQQGVLALDRVVVGYVGNLGLIKIGPFTTGQARKAVLRVELDAPSVRQKNEWDVWLIPCRKRVVPSGKVAGFGRATGLAGRFTASQELARADVLLTDRLTPDLLDYVVKGGKAIIFSESGALARPKAYTFDYQWIRSTGTFVEHHPAVTDIPHDGFCAYQMRRLFGGGVAALDITEQGSVERDKLTPIVWALHSDANPERSTAWDDPDNRWKFFRTALISEGRVGEGKILVCSLKLIAGIRSELPEASYLLDCLVDYALSSDFSPTDPPLNVREAQQLFVVEGAGLLDCES